MSKIIGHRGACQTAPENTIASGRRAAELGADIVEFDVRTSADGVLYVLHDSTLDRTTNGRGPISQWHSCDLDRLDAGSWFSPDFAGEPIPRMDGFLKALKPAVGFYVEVKDAAPSQVAAELAAAGLGSGCIMYSQNETLRTELRMEMPGQMHMVSFRDLADMDEACGGGAEILEFFSVDMTESRLRQARDLGFRTMMHTPLCDQDAFRRALAAGVDYLNIDFPETAAALRREIQGG